MSIVVLFEMPGMTTEQYNQMSKDLEASGEGSPAGLLFHVAAAKPDGLLVVDVWESREQFDRFTQALMPTFQTAGGAPTQPQIYQVHNLIKG